MNYTIALRCLILGLVFLGTALPRGGVAVASAALPGAAIWPSLAPRPGEVALFRTAFTVAAPTAVRLRIFADTRYEVWLDGRWWGRGPVRFSAVRQFYDTLTSDILAPGEHMLAVLVRYDPNTRRSENLGGGLWANLVDADDEALITASDESWRALSAAAWQPDAAQVSTIGLVGRQELLDLRGLPVDWQAPTFNANAAWAPAVRLGARFARLSPRPLPPLMNTPRLPVQVIESGPLAPGRRLLEWEQPVGTPTVTRTLRWTQSHLTTVVIEAVDRAPLVIDGVVLPPWQSVADPRRPDVVRQTITLAAGRHELVVGVPGGGRSLLIAPAMLALEDAPPLRQGTNPGRRMLLAEPVAELTAATSVVSATDGWTLAFPDGPRQVVLDLGRTVHARLQATVDGPAGTVVDVGWDERLLLNRPLPAPGSLHHGLWQQVDSWTLDGTPRPITTLDTRAGRYLVIAVWGPGPVQVRGLQIMEEHYPVTQRGAFRSADPMLNRIWQTGVDTLLPNMTDGYTDTPWRERGQWAGDVLPAFGVNEVAFGDLQLLRLSLQQFADTQDAQGRIAPRAPAHGDTGDMLDYQLIWLELLHRAWVLSADRTLLETHWPTAKRLITFVQRRRTSSGLLELPVGLHWSQTALIDWSGWDSRDGISTALNAQYAGALAQMVELGAALGDNQVVAYQQERERVVAALNERLLGNTGYATGLVGDARRPPTPQAQAWALRYEVVPPNAQAVVAATLAHGIAPLRTGMYPAVELYGLWWVLEALGQTQRMPDALQLIREQYGALLARGDSTWPETLQAQRWDNSCSHVWSGAPTVFLTRHLLGATRLSQNSWRVAPQRSDVAWAEGALPFDAAAMTLRWERPGCGVFRLTLAAPANTTGTVVLPVLPGARVTLNDVVVAQDGVALDARVRLSAAGMEIASVAGGEWHFVAEYPCFTQWLPVVSR